MMPLTSDRSLFGLILLTLAKIQVKIILLCLVHDTDFVDVISSLCSFPCSCFSFYSSRVVVSDRAPPSASSSDFTLFGTWSFFIFSGS